MTRSIKLLLFFLLFALGMQAQQNLFDCDQSKRFATYLFNTGQYDLSQHELERIKFFCETDSASQLLLLKTYRKLGKIHEGLGYYTGKSFTEINGLSNEFKTEYIRMHMTGGNYALVQQTIEQGLDFTERDEHLLGSQLMTKAWDKAYATSLQIQINPSLKIQGLQKVAEQAYLQKQKKPWLATLLSVVVPGSGKMYSGYWGDGAISFLFTASSTFFAYRAFQKYGPDKVYPWIVGGLAVSYYSANIYGGHQAALRYNNNLEHGLQHETEAILYSDY
jgi:hypothetical protein